MVALHEALRNVCRNFDWTYSVFWTIRPRPRQRCKVGDDNGSLMLMWEDGYCRTRAFSKMSIQLYNYGEGWIDGKVASDKCHKWVFKEPSSSSSNDCEPGIANYWQSSFDALPSEWTDQFASGIQTIAVIQAGHGLLQLIPEDLHFVLRMRHTFESLGYQSSYYFSTIFSSSSSSSSAAAAAARAATSPSPSHSFPSHLFNWSTPPSPPPPSTTPPPPTWASPRAARWTTPKSSGPPVSPSSTPSPPGQTTPSSSSAAPPAKRWEPRRRPRRTAALSSEVTRNPCPGHTPFPPAFMHSYL
ncbi:unnamed protein product [Spirodela intermedia]|uniref:Transcription factor MYC/MYB N-terminal domain-containing protein n=1 Tax=Spirodela intermedia TaxID=51605 RepID=A0A7I8JFZ8_SPIIN|nr:unnamed protein product [Spirodela intermedia]CAA6668675.1 unnamed protein product [Spirodela intermedia]